jgi:hypothetical protein
MTLRISVTEAQTVILANMMYKVLQDPWLAETGKSLHVYQSAI